MPPRRPHGHRAMEAGDGFGTRVPGTDCRGSVVGGVLGGTLRLRLATYTTVAIAAATGATSSGAGSQYATASMLNTSEPSRPPAPSTRTARRRQHARRDRGDEAGFLSFRRHTVVVLPVRAGRNRRRPHPSGWGRRAAGQRHCSSSVSTASGLSSRPSRSIADGVASGRSSGGAVIVGSAGSASWSCQSSSRCGSVMRPGYPRCRPLTPCALAGPAPRRGIASGLRPHQRPGSGALAAVSNAGPSHPASASRSAGGDSLWPAPTTTASTCGVVRGPSDLLRRVPAPPCAGGAARTPVARTGSAAAR
ncbi:hypothetical protein SAMN05216207_10587 [Pseudonocardia ammonioxydans]|uniref:Uncharacterized protein n=1 Tax=Pseudonocardia ammonioxydans TaxID=260086 RepID=A0A1I5H5U3_PSUAM|nr:hypothetical protein SAMN05216207_10587 [Pseudonocardia ammonioxydans]